MYVVCVTVTVKPGHEEDFATATEKNHHGSISEARCVRFDVLRAEDNPHRFFLYEVYRDKDAFVAHQKTEHYFTWRAAVADWMAERRVGTRHLSLFPAESGF